MRFLTALVIGIVSSQDLCGESCDLINKELTEVYDLIAELEAENAAIEAENAQIEQEINRLYLKIFPTEVHAASCQEILEKELGIKSETGHVYSNGEFKYKIAIEDINQKGFKYFSIDANEIEKFGKLGLTAFPSEDQVIWDITLFDENGYIGIQYMPIPGSMQYEYLAAQNFTQDEWENVRSKMSLTFGNGFIRLEGPNSSTLVELEDSRIHQAEINHIMVTTFQPLDGSPELIKGTWHVSATNKIIDSPDEMPSNGMYKVHPLIDLDPFWVECQFDGGVGSTYIYPNMTNPDGLTSTPGLDDGCDEPGCYVDYVTYNGTSKAQIEALLTISHQCYQSIKNKCSVNGLTNKAAWIDRNGAVRQYWDGAIGNEKGQGCACSLTDGSECQNYHNPDMNNVCNCDDLDSQNEDLGFLNNMEQIPVSELRYGDSLGRYSWIEYKLGPLVCSGQGAIYPSESFEHDFKWKVTKDPEQGNFLNSGSGLNFDNVIYDRSRGSLSFGDNAINNGTAFTSPIDGNFKFEVALFLTRYDQIGNQYSYLFDIAVQVNGKTVDYFQANEYNLATGYAFQFGYDFMSSVTIPLKIGDVVSFKRTDYFIEYYIEDRIMACKTGDIAHSCSYISGEFVPNQL